MAVLHGNLIYDVGMHLGEDTAFYLKKGFAVVGFEANPELVAQCSTRFEGALADGRLQIVEGVIAPANNSETITFYKNLYKSDWGTVDQSWADRNTMRGSPSERIELPRIDVIDAFNKFGIPHYLKTDVEGVDTHVIAALSEFDLRPRYVSIEAEVSDKSRFYLALSMLRDLGYSRFMLVQQANIPGKVMRFKNVDGRELIHTFEKHASGPFGEDLDQPWTDFNATLHDFTDISRLAQLFGDRSRFSRLPKPVRKLAKLTYRLLTRRRGPLPGWYDLHATR